MRSAHRACDDFHRASGATRRRYLGGGGLTRRQLIGRGLGAGLSVYAAQSMPLARVFEAAEAEAQAAPDAPVLVAVFLSGGLDLLDTLVPNHAYGRYADLRPRLKVENAPSLDERSPAGVLGDQGAGPGGGLGIHPSLGEGAGGGVHGLWRSGKIGFLPGIDYANPDLSHFHSRHFWETGLITERDAPGWLGRWLDHNGSRENPLQGLSVSYELSPVMRSGAAPVAAVSSPGGAGFWIRDTWGDPFDQAMDAYTRMGYARGGGPGRRAAATAARLSTEVAAKLAPFEEQNGNDPLASPVAYPEDSDFAKRLRTAAALIAQPLGIRAVTIEADGDFDTHDNQRELTPLLADVSRGLSAFQADLEARGVADRVLTFVWSEFGRRPEENDSGTDHGAGGIAWVQGTRARSGILCDYPSLDSFDEDDNLKVTMDFRTVYSSLLEQWLQTDAGAVIPGAGSVGRVQLVR